MIINNNNNNDNNNWLIENDNNNNNNNNNWLIENDVLVLKYIACYSYLCFYSCLHVLTNKSALSINSVLLIKKQLFICSCDILYCGFYLIIVILPTVVVF